MSATQLNLMDLFDGKTLAKAGLSVALEHAEGVAPGWKERAWQLFLEWLCSKPQGYCFRVEQFREWVKDKIECPPSLRSYGMVSKRGVKEGLICFNRKVTVSNPKAHAANANEWRVIG